MRPYTSAYADGGQCTDGQIWATPDQVETCAGTVGTDVQQQPKNEINSKYF
ncbi:hypothetical protein ACSAZL_13535 [Methanosarcina sp. T3]|uniref:hypothetical protein n=1 Tax=Methanosarcina sp. T3 TaxID=3439062 RepID=UPI003F82C350